MTVKNRIIEFIEAKKISKRGFADSIGKSNSYVNNIVSTITADVLNKIRIVYPELNIDWLLTGEGDMLKNISDKPHNANSHESLGNNEFISFLRDQISELKYVIEGKDREINNLNQEIGRLKGILDENKIQYRQTGT